MRTKEGRIVASKTPRKMRAVRRPAKFLAAAGDVSAGRRGFTNQCRS
jgi:hypothetical protein